MSVKIRKAKVIDPLSQWHGKTVDIQLQAHSQPGVGQAIFNDAAEGKSSISSGDKLLWEGEDLFISRGFIDIFADYREPGYEQKETIESGLRAAVAGGFTDVFLVPNTNPVTGSKSSVQYLLQKAKGGPVTIHPLGCITKDIEGKTLAEMLDMQAYGAVAFTDGWKPVQNAGLMLKAFEYARSFDGVLLQVPVDASLSAGGLMHEGIMSTKLGMAGIPVLAETILIHRDIELLRYTDSRLHITGVSTAEGVEMMRKAKGERLKITASVTPYHLALTDDVLATYDSLYKVTPVLRSEPDRMALIQGLKDGTIDCIASHHRPQEWDAKAKEFEYSGDGMNVQEVAFSIAYDALEGEVPMETIVEAFTTRPADIFGLNRKALDEGMTAATLFTAGTEWTLAGQQVRSASANNPFIGRSFSARVLGIVNQNNIHLNS